MLCSFVGLLILLLPLLVSFGSQRVWGMWVLIYVCAREAQRLTLSIFLNRSPPCFETGWLTELGIYQFG